MKFGVFSRLELLYGVRVFSSCRFERSKLFGVLEPLILLELALLLVFGFLPGVNLSIESRGSYRFELFGVVLFDSTGSLGSNISINFELVNLELSFKESKSFYLESSE